MRIVVVLRWIRRVRGSRAIEKYAGSERKTAGQLPRAIRLWRLGCACRIAYDFRALRLIQRAGREE